MTKPATPVHFVNVKDNLLSIAISLTVLAMADVTQTDVSRPSALPTGRLRPTASQAAVLVEQNSTEYLDAVEEEWNKKVDAEVETLVDGMCDIVGLASIGDKDKFRIAQESFQAECRAESMVRCHLLDCE